MKTQRGKGWQHALFWAGIYLLWIALFQGRALSLSRTATVEACYLIFITADVYVIGYLFARASGRGQLIASGAIAISVLAVSAVLRVWVAQYMIGYVFKLPVGPFATLLVNSLVNISFWVLLLLAVKFVLDRAAAQRQLQALEQEKLRSEHDYLKAQMNPHMLFNSLNTLYGHIDKGNVKAREILLQLSDSLRYQLYECGADRVNLGNELTYLANYVALQRLRHEENLTISSVTNGCDMQLLIAPLLLIVLVENAFKFVDGERPCIAIETGTENGALLFSISNTIGDGAACVAQDKQVGGIGLVNLKRRLELLYPGAHQLTLTNLNSTYTATLNIQLT